eukprot:TRINITY_DN19498_c0_g1_i1.p1 TRINITY_DN19498_c0_g1~~TRINITY_DN19498_c0_g1_i1.p1  ORF type:complete len:509 (+),score=79.93 TRINITY_DN19498_c0_g1_i1:359-1885(+)
MGTMILLSPADISSSLLHNPVRSDLHLHTSSIKVLPVKPSNTFGHQPTGYRFSINGFDLQGPSRARRGVSVASAQSLVTESVEESPHAEEGAKMASLREFTRFFVGNERTELQTSVVTYWKRGPWWDILKPEIQVDLVAAVHIADKDYFEGLQEDLDTYDRVLYEMVADKGGRRSRFLGRKGAASSERWRPPPMEANRRRRGGGIISTIQRSMSSLLGLEFQLECMEYTGDNWYHADLDMPEFQRLQEERGETFLSFAGRVAETSTKALKRSMVDDPSSDMFFADEDGMDEKASLGLVQRNLLWAARVLPMPLLGSLIIRGVCRSPGDASLRKSPEVRALLNLDLATALKVMLAKQLTDTTMDMAASVLSSSVIVGERNRAACEALEEALSDGCRRVAIFYGSGHLPDLDRRLREDFGMRRIDQEWRTAWAIKGRKREAKGAISKLLARMQRATNWPLNRYQTTALLLFSAVLAVDLWVWEVLLQSGQEYVFQGIEIVTAFLNKGWEV